MGVSPPACRERGEAGVGPHRKALSPRHTSNVCSQSLEVSHLDRPGWGKGLPRPASQPRLPHRTPPLCGLSTARGWAQRTWGPCCSITPALGLTHRGPPGPSRRQTPAPQPPRITSNSPPWDRIPPTSPSQLPPSGDTATADPGHHGAGSHHRCYSSAWTTTLPGPAGYCLSRGPSLTTLLCPVTFLCFSRPETPRCGGRGAGSLAGGAILGIAGRWAASWPPSPPCQEPPQDVVATDVLDIASSYSGHERTLT